MESQENRPGEVGMEVVGGAQGRGSVPSSNALREERTWEETGAAKQRGVLRGAQLMVHARQFGELGLCAVGNRKAKSRSLVQGRGGTLTRHLRCGNKAEVKDTSSILVSLTGKNHCY